MKRVAILVLILSAIGALYGLYLFNKKPSDIRDMKADYEISSIDLIKEFSVDEEKATKKYNDKVLLVSGKVSEVNLSSSTVFLYASDTFASVTCSFYTDELPHLQTIKKDDAIQVKGKCTGKLIDVVLNNCRLSLSK